MELRNGGRAKRANTIFASNIREYWNVGDAKCSRKQGVLWHRVFQNYLNIGARERIANQKQMGDRVRPSAAIGGSNVALCAAKFYKKIRRCEILLRCENVRVYPLISRPRQSMRN